MISWPRNVPPPSETVFRAANGEEEAVLFVLRQFEPLIHHLSMRVPIGLREDVEDEIRVLLLESLRNFQRRRPGAQSTPKSARSRKPSHRRRHKGISIRPPFDRTSVHLGGPPEKGLGPSLSVRGPSANGTRRASDPGAAVPRGTARRQRAPDDSQGTAFPSPSASSRGASPQSLSRS